MKSKAQEQYEKETGKKALVFPVNVLHGYPSMEYQLWLEDKASQFSSSQPCEGREVYVERFTQKREFPVKDGYYNTTDTMGEVAETLFSNGHWYSRTGHPVASWLSRTTLPPIAEEKVSEVKKWQIIRWSYDGGYYTDALSIAGIVGVEIDTVKRLEDGALFTVGKTNNGKIIEKFFIGWNGMEIHYTDGSATLLLETSQQK